MVSWDEAVRRAQTRQVMTGQQQKVSWLRRVLPRRASGVVVTGAAGSGKTVFYGLVTGQPVTREQSKDREAGFKPDTPGRRRLSLMTVPGQTTRKRRESLEVALGEDARVAGVIHVCSFGFHKVWPDQVRDYDQRVKRAFRTRVQRMQAGVARGETLESEIPDSPEDRDYRQASLDLEIDDVEQTLARIEEKVRGNNALGPRWMIVVANKADLYWSDIESAKAYYNIDAPDGESDFRDLLSKFKSDTRIQELGIEVLPFASVDETHNFGYSGPSGPVPSELDVVEREALNSVLMERLEELTR